MAAAAYGQSSLERHELPAQCGRRSDSPTPPSPDYQTCAIAQYWSYRYDHMNHEENISVKQPLEEQAIRASAIKQWAPTKNRRELRCHTKAKLA